MSNLDNITFNYSEDVVNPLSISDSSSLQFKNNKDLLMYYHTTLRNVGLFTSVALAGIGAGRGLSASKQKTKIAWKKLYAVVTYIFSLAFLAMAMRMSHLLIRDIRASKEYLDSSYQINDWLLIPYVIYAVAALLVVVGVGSIIRTMYKLFLNYKQFLK